MATGLSVVVFAESDHGVGVEGWISWVAGAIVAANGVGALPDFKGLADDCFKLHPKR